MKARTAGVFLLGIFFIAHSVMDQMRGFDRRAIWEGCIVLFLVVLLQFPGLSHDRED